MTRLFEAKPFIVAEIGSNWTTLPECLASIAAAKRVGASAAKFQLYDHEALYGEPAPGVWQPGEPLKGCLPQAWLPQLKAMCDDAGIEFMCTAFSPELVAVVDPYVSVHKVASSDAAWPQMLEAVARTGKPVLISHGAKTDEESDRIGNFFGDRYHEDVIPLYCVANYPADYTDVAVEGLSDHTLGYTACVLAAQHGAKVIEKHFTAFPDLDTPDRPHSLTPDQFARMVKLIRGEPVESEEKDMYLRHNRRLIATRDIPLGESLRYGVNFGSYRSLKDDTRGLSPFEWERVNGRMAAKAIGRGDAIGEGDFQ